jgi:hypothetical protein
MIELLTACLWHRRGRPPRPVFVVRSLPEKVRVVDAVKSTTRHLLCRDVFPHNLTRLER